MSLDSSIFSLLNLVESVDKITTSAVARRVGKCEMSVWNRNIMIRIERLLKHVSKQYAKLMNDCRTINRIPPEILLLIFSFAGRGETISMVSCVCKWWRQLAISSPALWTLYNPALLPRLNVVLQRSRNAPLDIYVRVKFVNTYLSRALESRMDRLRTFDVTFTSENAPSRLVKEFPSAAMNLERLSLSTTKKYYHHPYQNFGMTAHFASLFGGNMPRLRILRLNSIRIWPQLSGPSLQYLVLTNYTLHVPDLLSALQNIPCLEVLVLVSVVFRGLPDPLDLECVVMMESLRMLLVRVETKIHDQSIQVHNFLSSLVLHEGVAVYLNVSSRSRDRESQLPPAVANDWTYSVDGMHTLCFGEEIIASDDRSFVTYGLRRPCYIEVVPDRGIFFGSFYCRLAHVTHLILEPHMTPLIQRRFDWPTFFGSMPLLESISASPYSDRELYRICEILLEVDPITLVPRYALRLVDMTVTFWRKDLFGMYEFTKFLEARCAFGYPIKRVKLLSDGLPDTYVEQMKKYVHEVTLIFLKRYDHLYGTPDDRPLIPRHFVEVEPDNIYSEYFDLFPEL